MKLGFVSIYSYRPFVKHLTYIASLLSEAGHESYFLVCDSSVDKCYSQLLKNHSKMQECPTCILGGFRSFPLNKIDSINSKIKSNLDEETLQRIASSSSYTIHRIENIEDSYDSDILHTQKLLYDPINIVHGNVVDWINKNNLDGIICFNGRMELTQAVIYGCENFGLPYITVERPWFGHGLHLTPNGNCLSLKEFNRFNLNYRHKPLTAAQAKYAAHLMSIRFLQKNELDWRVHQFDSQGEYLQENLIKILILPSSKNEFIGHPDWNCEWNNYTEAIDQLIQRLGIPYSQCVLRCHPIWAERIGRNTGEKAEKHYYEWAKNKGVFCIPSHDKTNTYSLIKNADIVVVTNSSTGVEAGFLGKKVIALGRSRYQEGEFAIQIHSNNDWSKIKLLKNHNKTRVIRQTLRYIYTHACRVTQYVNQVRFVSSAEYKYYDGGDPDKILNILKTGMLDADDLAVAENTVDEDKVINDIINLNWERFASWEFDPKKNPRDIDRRLWLRWIDPVRYLFPTGDR